MKKICTIILILAGITYSYAQSKIEGYEYWFNNDFANKTTTNVAPTQQLLVNQSVSVTGLTSGVHTFNFRSFDDKGKYSAVISSFFYKPSALESSPNPEITAYEYWVDNSYGDAVLVNTAAQQQLSIDELISMSSLPNGIHVFNIRFKDSRGLWSSTTSEFFYKMPPPAPGSSNLVSYEYWFDNDYQNAVTANTPVQSPVVINEMVDAQTLPAGIHIFNIRFKDDRGLWSSTTSEFFYKMAAQSVTNNLIVGYRYWLNDDFENATVEALETPVKQFSLIDNLDFTSIPKGDYTISFQFKDTLGLWSSVTTDSIAKVSLPISNFTYTTQVECDSTIAYFTNLSVDADDYLWEFGDGNSSTLANPIHTYYTPSTYQVSLTVTDTLMGTDSTMVLPMEIISLNTDSTITATACDSYTAPDGEVYTTSGIKTAVIPNAAGCDSTITIDLTILHSTASSITATACD
ncbi:MAG: PKD domain-containing protein, partial [Tenuifilaceae bacterium]|nr:PKD domain-containing protein [Tenuifilaceae bacterium]